MRKVILQMSVTVDGYVGGGDWRLPPELPEVTAWKLTSLQGIGAHLMGRTTYQEMAGFWPTADSPYAAPMNTTPKVVFSGSLQQADWPDTRIVRGDLARDIGILKAEPGGDLMVHGGASFVQALSRLTLVDEYRLVILPVAAGGGLPLFQDLPEPLRLDLAEAATFPDGTAIHVYRPAA